MKTLAELTQELVAIGISAEHAQVAAARQYAALIEQKEAAEAETRKAADEAAGVDEWCGVRCSGISYLDKDGKKIVSPMLRNAKCLEDGIGLEPAKPGATPTDGSKPVFYPPKLWIMVKGRKPAALTQFELSGLVTMIEKHGADKVIGLIREVASPAAIAKFETDKKAGIAAGLYQDTDNRKNRKA